MTAIEFSDIIGYFGMALLLLNYVFLVKGVLKSSSYAYHVINVTGSIGLSVSAMFIPSYPHILLNAAFAIIGLIGVREIAKIRQTIAR